MKKERIIFCILFISFINLNQLAGQESINSSAGKATGTGGTINYSVGQAVFNTYSSDAGAISEGVQQPYEIYVTTGIDMKTVNLSLNVYPNPTSNVLNLMIDDEANGLSFQLHNVDGKILKSKIVKSKETQIEMVGLVPSIYFLRIIKKGQIVKSFKIIKN